MEAASVIARGAALELLFVPPVELERIRLLDVEPVERATAFADACRINTLSMVMEAGSGHLGTSFSAMDVLAWLHLELLGPDDRYFSSKGHDAPGLYATLIGTGALEFDLVHRLRRLDGLTGHPDVHAMPQVHTNTGSLGMGVSKAKGFVRANRLNGCAGSVYVLTGDGELQEGQFWESLQQAANEGLYEITVIVDHNKIQSDTWVSEVSDLGDLEAKFAAFGWAVARCDGNDIAQTDQTLQMLSSDQRRPKVLIADTLKGCGVSFMEPHDLERSGTALYQFHSGAPNDDQYARALAELTDRLASRLDDLGVRPPELVATTAPVRSASPKPQKLVTAYGDALADAAVKHEQIVVFDADLYLDTGLIPFRSRFPERFIECGIAEQDMVSQAGAMALSGLLPVVNSFACFLSTRPNEQIYNNATEGTKVIYVGSLAGLVPGGPGHSHQSVRDISALGGMPGMTLLEPYCESETRRCVEWAVGDATGPVYIRLVSVPWEFGFEPPQAEPLVKGRGTVLRDGCDVVLVTTGPVLVSQAWRAAQLLAAQDVDCGVIALPWLRGVDVGWLTEAVGTAALVCLDNHYAAGGQGEAVIAALSVAGALPAAGVHHFAVDSVPVCGTNEEVLRAHRLDAPGIVDRVVAVLPARV